MALNDHEYVNFSEDYELNYHLKKVNKSQSIANRSTLVTMGNELKTLLSVTFLTHKQFHEYISKSVNLRRLDD